MLPLHVMGSNVFAYMPIWFRQQELPPHIKWTRNISGSTFDRIAVFTGFWCALIVYGASLDAHCLASLSLFLYVAGTSNFVFVK